MLNINKCYKGNKQGDIMEGSWKFIFSSVIGEGFLEDNVF